MNTMARTREQNQANATPGFAIEIKDDTELGLAMLIAYLGDGFYQPIGVVVSINEAREIAASDLQGRKRGIEAGKTSALPRSYVVWAQGLEGDYREVKRLMP
jgi:hypothetical protein